MQTLTVTAGDQITSAGYGHDASGNTTAGPSVGSTAGYTYAGTDQVELIAQSGGRDYTYGRANSTGVPIIESYTAGSTTTSYTYDPQGTPLAVEGANSHYLALDGLGSPVALVNNSGGQTAAYSYDPYGGMTATAVNGSGAIGIQLYGYAGGFDDPASGLVHFGQRWSDPATGRFTQPDNLEVLADLTRANRYEYAASNPTSFVDPLGKNLSVPAHARSAESSEARRPSCCGIGCCPAQDWPSAPVLS